MVVGGRFRKFAWDGDVPGEAPILDAQVTESN